MMFISNRVMNGIMTANGHNLRGTNLDGIQPLKSARLQSLDKPRGGNVNIPASLLDAK